MLMTLVAIREPYVLMAFVTNNFARIYVKWVLNKVLNNMLNIVLNFYFLTAAHIYTLLQKTEINIKDEIARINARSLAQTKK